jgi:hypothetical protein
LLSATPALAQLSIERLWVDFGPGDQPRADLVLVNQSKDRYYITVAPKEVKSPGEPTEAKVVEGDPETLGLIVTPNRLVLEPGGSRSIRFVSLNHDLKRDRIYRVLVSPQVGEIVAPQATGTDHALAIKILTAYEVLVTVRPDHPVATVKAERDATGLVLTNTGNSNALLFDGRDCARSAGNVVSDKSCTKIPSRRLYSENMWRVPLNKPDDKVSFSVKISEDKDPQVQVF